MAILEFVAGGLFGFALDRVGDTLARRDERRHQRREKAHDRELDAVAVLDDALREAHWRLPGITGTEESRQAIFDAHDAWQDGLFRIGRLVRDDDLLDRYRAAGWALLTALLDERRGTHSDQWVVVRGINNARAACAALMRDEPLPEPTFPTTIEAKRLTQIESDGNDFSALHEWLGRHVDPGEAP